MRFNTDERLRGLERQAETGGLSDRVAYLRERLRAGQVAEAEVMDQARKGDEASLLALDLTLPQIRMIDVLGGRGKKPRNAAEAERAIRAYYAAMGFVTDRFGALVGDIGDGKQARLIFKTRVVEEHHGRPGAWRKIEGLSLVRHAESLAAKAAGPGGVAKLKEKREAEQKKSVVRKTKEQVKRNVLRAANVLMSVGLSPEERLAAVVDDSLFEPRAVALVGETEAQLDDNATEEQIDAMLSISSPPVFLPADRRGARNWPTSFKWRDPQSGFDVEVKRKAGTRSLSIIIGNVPVDPVSGGVIPDRMFSATTDLGEEGGYTGLSGTIRLGIYSDDEPQAQLYYIQAAKKREGLARRMIRVFCRLVGAYGFKSFVALGVGEEGAAMILGLHDQGELAILGRRGSSIFVRCADALDDPRQQRLFGPQPKPNPAAR